ncbi:MAG TPA: ABC transporter substrate-binding protein [Reyranella sp.]
MPVIGFMSGRSAGDSAHLVDAFRQGLAAMGFVEGQNVTIEYRWAEGRYDRLQEFAADFVGRKVDAIVAGGATDAARAAKDATVTIPIVFTFGSDPVEVGLVKSMARPASNITGVTFIAEALNPKLLELARELVPNARVIAVLVNSTNSTSKRQVRIVQDAASRTRVRLKILEASTAAEIDAAFDTLGKSQVDGLIVVPEAFFMSRREQLASLAARHAIPAVYGFREFVAVGGLISYGASFAGVFRQVGNYAGKILKGVKPGDLPITQPTTFELVINVKAAKDLGITIPLSILARADEVIE